MKLGLLNIRPQYTDSNVPISVPNGTDYLASFINHHLPSWNAYVEYDEKKLMERKPDLVGLSSFTRTYNEAIKISREIKNNFNIPVIIGGHHISAIPDNLDYSMDVGVLGEGENTLLELVKLFEKGNFNEEGLNSINGIVYRNNEGLLIRTNPRELIPELDILPLPYRTIVKDVKGFWNQSIFTSRGCPFRCKYCAISEFWDKIRYHSPERVIMELSELISKTKCEHITIHDDLFGINKKRLKLLVDAIRHEKIHHKVSFICNARASVFDDEICQMFVDMNIRSCVFGMESANDRILNYMKGSTNAKQNQKAIDLCKKHNIVAIPNFIVGFPTETKNEASDTYWFIRRNMTNLTDFRIFPACPLPGTHLWDYALSKEIVPKEFNDWQELDFIFDTEKSVFLNNGLYDKYEYSTILNEFYSLREHTKPYAIVAGEILEKDKYTSKLFNLIVDYTKINTKELNILEISNLGLSIESKLPFKEKIFSGNITNGKLNIENINQKFDAILFFHSLELTREPEKELEKIKALLNPDGYIVIVTYNMNNPLIILKILTENFVYSSWGPNQRKIISHFSDISFSSSEENKVEALKNFCGKNIYDSWGIGDLNNISFFTKKQLEKLINKSGFKVFANKEIIIETDNNAISFYEQINKLFKNYFQPDITPAFTNITFLKNQ
jgi:anaerobic magnesium-protoporphyrin IX monomethyl ester cyclase